jgi:hypothetical protein
MNTQKTLCVLQYRYLQILLNMYAINYQQWQLFSGKVERDSNSA